MTLLASAVYGTGPAPPDPAVPAADVEAALAGITVALLAERLPDGGAAFLAKLGVLAATGMPDSREEP